MITRLPDPVARAQVTARTTPLVQIVAGMVRRQTISNATLIAAGAAFWLVLAVVPMLSATISLAALLIEPQSVVDELDKLLGGLPPDVADTLDAIATSISTSSTGLSVGLAVSVIAAIWSVGTGGMYLMRAVTQAWEQPETRGYVGLRIRAMSMAAIAILVIVAILAAPNVVPTLTDRLSVGATVALEALRVILSLIVLGGALNAFYRHATPTRLGDWRSRVPGSLLATVLIIIGTQAYAFYAANFSNYSSLYGALAGVVIAMVLMWLIVVFVLYGAMLNAELLVRRQRRTIDQSPAAAPAAAAPGPGP